MHIRICFFQCQDTLDVTIISGTSEEVVIIGPYNTAARIDEYTYIYDPSEGAGGKVCMGVYMRMYTYLFVSVCTNKMWKTL